MAIRQAVIKFPDNLKVASKLEPSDRATIAEKSGYSPAYISDILKGRRRMVDKVKKAIVDLIKERQKLDKALEEITNN